MAYQEVLTRPFLNDVKDIKKDKNLLDRLDKKMDEIVEQPEHYPLKRHNLKGKRAAHVGSYVVVFEVQGEEIVFLRFKHHDFAYD
ncbi:MAG: type II toxin-antitoxin system RelE/ParE family toxin [Nanoarchaeota archaeon]